MVSTIEYSANKLGLRSGRPARTLFRITCAVVLAFASAPAHSASIPISLVLTVLGPDDKPVPEFEAMLHSHQHGYIRWQTGTDGEIDFRSDGVQTLRTGTDPKFQVVVRAPGLAPAVLNLENRGSRIRETVRLTPGRLVELSIHTANGGPIPESVTPLVVYTDFAWRVRMMRQPQNVKSGYVFDFVMSKVHRTAEGRYQFHAPAEPAPFFLAIHEPGFVRSLESEIITEDELTDNRIEWHLPAPAKVRIQFDLSDENDLPTYRFAHARVASYIPEVGKYYTVWLQQYETLSFDVSIDDLAPGRHVVHVILVPQKQDHNEGDRKSTPHVFRDKVMLDLSAGQQRKVVLGYTPFEPDAWRGKATATVKVSHYDGRPTADEPFTLSYIAPHYGEVTVLEDRLDAQGRFQLKNVHAGPGGPEFFLRFGDHWSRRMQMTRTGSQDFEFTLAPQVGDRVPDVRLLDLATSQPVSLGSLRGSIIYLEFWATWCGPCKMPMIQLNESAGRRRNAWDGRVHILAASIDDGGEIVQRYVKQRGWTHVRHLWAGAETDRPFESKVSRAFGLYGVPTALLIDTEGRIVWRGDPKSADCETQIDELLQRTGAEPPAL